MHFVVGDIHGEITKLRKLVGCIDATDPSASFIFVGDYLDKGEDVLVTLHFLSEFAKHKPCTFLMGNHEFLWMNLQEKRQAEFDVLFRIGASRTMMSLGTDDMLEAKSILLERFPDFFGQLAKFWMDDHYLVVHSGIDPVCYQTGIDAIAIEKLLFNRYDFIRQQRLFQDTHKVIFGHTGFYFPYIDDYKIGIDTAACFLETQPLTAFCLEERFFINSFGNRFAESELHNKDVCPNIPRIKPWRERC